MLSIITATQTLVAVFLVSIQSETASRLTLGPSVCVDKIMIHSLAHRRPSSLFAATDYSYAYAANY